MTQKPTWTDAHVLILQDAKTIYIVIIVWLDLFLFGRPILKRWAPLNKLMTYRIGNLNSIIAALRKSLSFEKLILLFCWDLKGNIKR